MAVLSIALDGPSGAGKSTIAKALAQEFDAMYMDTGAMYRAVGLYMQRAGFIEVVEETAAAQEAEVRGENGPRRTVIGEEETVAAHVTEVPLEVRYENGQQQTLLGDEDVSLTIREPDVSLLASFVAKIPAVRRHLVALQRELSKHTSIIMDGRDIGTVVLPDAPVKIFLTATSESRAQRRVEQLARDHIIEPYEKVLAEIIQRDEQDSSRDTTPLRQADDAILLDTTEMTEQQTIDAIIDICRRAIQ